MVHLKEEEEEEEEEEVEVKVKGTLGSYPSRSKQASKQATKLETLTTRLYVSLRRKRRNSCQLTGSSRSLEEQPLKYLREVTPYFRKASIIQEVGWELQRGFLSATPPPPKSPPRADTRYLPLQLCRLTRAHPSSDPAVEIQLDKDTSSTNIEVVLFWTSMLGGVSSGSRC
ncbi:hypothetical protein M0802_009413 [Mischocyttarus mexicanus]|nr:hypothetical protein M0802_009413 [Mischocyttarus mexicanus]